MASSEPYPPPQVSSATPAHDYIAEMSFELSRLAEMAGDEGLARALKVAGVLAQARQSNAA